MNSYLSFITLAMVLTWGCLTTGKKKPSIILYPQIYMHGFCVIIWTHAEIALLMWDICSVLCMICVWACLHHQSYLTFLDGFVKINRKPVKPICIFSTYIKSRLNVTSWKHCLQFVHEGENVRQTGAFRFSLGRNGWYRPSPVLWSKKKKKEQWTLILWVIQVIMCYFVPTVESPLEYFDTPTCLAASTLTQGVYCGYIFFTQEFLVVFSWRNFLETFSRVLKE